MIDTKLVHLHRQGLLPTRLSQVFLSVLYPIQLYCTNLLYYSISLLYCTTRSLLYRKSILLITYSCYFFFIFFIFFFNIFWSFLSVFCISVRLSTLTHVICKDWWYTHGLIVLTTSMVLTYTHGIVLILLNHMIFFYCIVATIHDFEWSHISWISLL